MKLLMSSKVDSNDFVFEQIAEEQSPLNRSISGIQK